MLMSVIRPLLMRSLCNRSVRGVELAFLLAEIIAILSAERQRVQLPQALRKLQFRAQPFPCLDVFIEHASIGLAAGEILPIIISLSGNLDDLGNFMGILDVHIASVINRAQTAGIAARQKC